VQSIRDAWDGGAGIPEIAATFDIDPDLVEAVVDEHDPPPPADPDLEATT
jgi:hypothetical protein